MGLRLTILFLLFLHPLFGEESQSPPGCENSFAQVLDHKEKDKTKKEKYDAIEAELSQNPYLIFKTHDLGEGGFSRVFAATVTQQDKSRDLVAVKISEAGTSANYLQAEFNNLRKIQEKPIAKFTVKPITLHSLSSGGKAMVMENFAGKPLTSLLRGPGPGNALENAALFEKIIIKLIHAQKAMEESGFVHFDIKPQNILYRIENGEVEIVLIDFAGLLEVNTLLVNRPVGTPRYTNTYHTTSTHAFPNADRGSLHLVIDELLDGPILARSTLYDRVYPTQPNLKKTPPHLYLGSVKTAYAPYFGIANTTPYKKTNPLGNAIKKLLSLIPSQKHERLNRLAAANSALLFVSRAEQVLPLFEAAQKDEASFFTQAEKIIKSMSPDNAANFLVHSHYLMDNVKLLKLDPEFSRQILKSAEDLRHTNKIILAALQENFMADFEYLEKSLKVK
jgi:serine/threonine protein kinase